MHCLIVAGGSPHDLPDDLSILGPYDVLVCADGGVHNARRLGLVPQMVIGDLDSLGHDAKAQLAAAGCRFLVHPPAKNETDLELALLWCLGQGATAITVIGAFGDRPDHTIANVILLADPRFGKLPVHLRSRRWHLWLARRSATISGQPGDTVSLIPLSDRVTHITTEGLVYALHDGTLRRGPARGVSNVLAERTAQVRFASGLLLIVHGPPGHEL